MCTCFLCEQAKCGVGSKGELSALCCRQSDDPGNNSARSQDQIVKVLEQRTPGQANHDSRLSMAIRATAVPRMFKARAPDGDAKRRE